MAVTVVDIFVRVTGTVFVVVLITFVLKLWTLIRVRRQHDMLLRSFPSAPEKHWFYGHSKMDSGKEDGIEKTVAMTKMFSHYYVHSTIAMSFLNLVHPDSFKVISSTAEPKNMTFFGLLKEWLGEGILINSGVNWRRTRRIVTPAFHFGMLKPYIKVYNECAHVMLDKWESVSEDEPVELFEHISLLTLDILLKCLFGTASNCQLDSGHNDYINGVRRFALLMKKRVTDWKSVLFGNFFYYYLTPDGYRWRKTRDMLHGYSRKLINQRKASRENGQTRKSDEIDFLDLLLDSKDKDGNGLADEDILAEVDTFLFEGHDTTASGISWFLYNLARHPEYQDKCKQEIDELMNAKDRDELDWDDIQNMSYLTMCLKESLRIHPPVARVSRRVTTSHQLPDGNVIQNGTPVYLAISSLHHNPHVWENPNVYDPTRFTKENCKNRPAHSFVPFSAGPRNCIGQKFAMDEMKVITALILRHFDLSVDGCPQPKRRIGLVLRADNGIHVNLKRRNLQERT